MSRELINSHYYLFSVGIIILAIVVFYFSYERRKPKAREMVTLAVMSAIAVAARAAFVMLPHFKPMSAIIMITGMAFGPGAGFLTGTISSFVSNFIFGQGPWTPWQMFAYGIGGLLAGVLAKRKLMHEENRVKTSVAGFMIVFVIVGPILDTCSIFTMGNVITREFVFSIYLSGLPVNIVHGTATFLTLLLLCRPMMEKLNRIKIKYGMMDGADYEI